MIFKPTLKAELPVLFTVRIANSAHSNQAPKTPKISNILK